MESHFRYSGYHSSLMDRSFLYVLFNTLVVPGLAIPTGLSLFGVVTNQLGKAHFLLLNFFNLPRADFFVVLFLQQISFGFLFSLVPVSLLYRNYFSPRLLQAKIRLNQSELNRFYFELCNFDFGFNYVQTIVMVCVCLVYWSTQ